MNSFYTRYEDYTIHMSNEKEKTIKLCQITVSKLTKHIDFF